MQRQDLAADSKAYARFSSLTGEQAFLHAWFEAFSNQHAAVRRAVVMVEDASGQALRPLAVWPQASTDIRDFAEVIGDAAERDGVATRKSGNKTTFVALALSLEGHLAAVIAAEAGTDEHDDFPTALELASGWLSARLWEQRALADRARFQDSFAALDSLAVVAEQRGLRAAALALVNELATRLPIDRAALGLVRMAGSGEPKLFALSGAAWFRKKGRLVGAVEAAMGEAVDQLHTVVSPGLSGRPKNVDVAQRRLIELRGSAAAASFVLFDEEVPVAALVVEVDSAPSDGPPIGEELLRSVEAIAGLVGPVIALKRRQHNLLAGRLVDWAGRGLRALFGRHHPSYRLAAVAIIALLVAPFVLEGRFTVTTDATLEGAVERAAVAPFAGFIKTASVRAGESVERDQVILVLEDRDLRLEAEKHRSALKRLDQEERQALAQGDQAERALLAARTAQTEAELALAVGKLERTRIRSPVDGVVLSGDHSQRIGAPVEIGELLYRIAPLDRYRVILDIDERDFVYVQPGQSATLVLSADTNREILLNVTSVTPVSRFEEGRKLFRAEAEPVQADMAGILPGLQGIAKVDIAERSYAWIWTRRVREWLALQLWRWQP